MNNEDYTRTLLTKYGFLSQTGRDSFPFIRSTAKTNHLKVFNFLKLFRGIKFLKDRHLQLSITCVRLVLSHSCVNKFHLGKKKTKLTNNKLTITFLTLLPSQVSFFFFIYKNGHEISDYIIQNMLIHKQQSESLPI